MTAKIRAMERPSRIMALLSSACQLVDPQEAAVPLDNCAPSKALEATLMPLVICMYIALRQGAYNNTL